MAISTLLLFKQNAKTTDKVYTLLLAIYGIGYIRAKQICAEAGISYTARLGELNTSQSKLLGNITQQIAPIGDKLKNVKDFRMLDIIALNTYRSSRHKIHLPVRGQRTHSNAQSQKRRCGKDMLMQKVTKSKLI